MFTKTTVSILAFIAGFFFLSRPLFDPDLGFHLAGGAYLSKQIASALSYNSFSVLSLIPEADFINTFSNFWHDYHWLSQLLMFGLYDLGGYKLLFFFFLIIVALTYYLLIKIVFLLSKNKVSPALALALIFPSFYLILDVASVRPHVISILLITLSLYQLLQDKVQKKSKFELISLFVYSIVLVNIHVYWVFIPFLWFCYRGLPRLLGSHKFSAYYVWGGLFLLISAGIFSPYSFLNQQVTLSNLTLNYSLLLDYIFFDSSLQNSITEFQTPLSDLNLTSTCLIIFVILLTRLINRKSFIQNIGVFSTALVGVFLYAGAIKYASIFAVLALPAFIILLRDNFTLELPKRLNLFLGTVLLILILTKISSNLNNIHWLENDLRKQMPIQACSIIAKQDQGAAVVATSFDYGSWCRFAMYQENSTANLQVTTDGRTQGVSVELYKKSARLYAAKEGWYSILKTWNPKYILVSREKALAHVLPFFKKEYQQIYGDSRFAVFKNLAIK